MLRHDSSVEAKINTTYVLFVSKRIHSSKCLALDIEHKEACIWHKTDILKFIVWVLWLGLAKSEVNEVVVVWTVNKMNIMNNKFIIKTNVMKEMSKERLIIFKYPYIFSWWDVGIIEVWMIMLSMIHYA